MAIEQTSRAGDDPGSDRGAMTSGIGHTLFTSMELGISMRPGLMGRPAKYDLEHIVAS
jgi:hypothetical protein